MTQNAHTPPHFFKRHNSSERGRLAGLGSIPNGCHQFFLFFVFVSISYALRWKGYLSLWHMTRRLRGRSVPLCMKCEGTTVIKKTPHHSPYMIGHHLTIWIAPVVAFAERGGGFASMRLSKNSSGLDNSQNYSAHPTLTLQQHQGFCSLSPGYR